MTETNFIRAVNIQEWFEFDAVLPIIIGNTHDGDN